MKGDGMPTEHKVDRSVETMDVKRLIEASSNNMISELSHACQVNHGNSINGCTQKRESERTVEKRLYGQSK